MVKRISTSYSEWINLIDSTTLKRLAKLTGGPLAGSRNDIFTNPILTEIS